MRLLLASLLRRWADKLYPERIEVRMVLPDGKQFGEAFAKARRQGYIHGSW